MSPEEAVEELAKLGILGSGTLTSGRSTPVDDDPLKLTEPIEVTIEEVDHKTLLRARARLLEEMPLGLREHLKSIDHLLGWPPEEPAQEPVDLRRALEGVLRIQKGLEAWLARKNGGAGPS